MGRKLQQDGSVSGKKGREGINNSKTLMEGRRWIKEWEITGKEEMKEKGDAVNPINSRWQA